MRIGFTGTREGMTIEQMNTVADILAVVPFLDMVSGSHGDCVGADSEFHAIFRDEFYDMPINVYPPEDDKYRAYNKDEYTIIYPVAPYLVRNKYIVDASNALIAAPKGFEEEQRSGTWSTIRYSIKTHVKVTIVYPDGSIETK